MGVSSAAAHGDAQSRHRDYGCILRRLPEGQAEPADVPARGRGRGKGGDRLQCVGSAARVAVVYLALQGGIWNCVCHCGGGFKGSSAVAPTPFCWSGLL